MTGNTLLSKVSELSMSGRKPRPREDLTGRRFGRFFVQCIGPMRGINIAWSVRCDCGNISVVRSGDLLSGKSTSCGCYRRENAGRRSRGHGQTKSLAYQSWVGMRTRCGNPKQPNHKNYGALGVTVCTAWQDSFEQFLADMGDRPSKAHTIDRIDPTGNYEPSNCRWATRAVQAANRRPREAKEAN